MVERLAPSRMVGPYELVARLGQGGMGEVWKARHSDLGRIVAVKILTNTEPEDLARFRREARLVARLNHPNIAQLFELGEDWEKPYIALQYVDGTPIDRAPGMLRERVKALRDAARAVQHAHENQVLHRDLKPQNILVDAAGRGIVLDFGLAREAKQGTTSLSEAGGVIGTPAYMAPEQARGDLDALDERCDVWGLGACLYTLLTGRQPFEGKTAYDVIMRVANQDPIPPHRLVSSVDRDLETIVLKTMEKEKSRRYQTAAEFADELDRWLKGEPIRARPASMIYGIRKSIRRQPVVWGLGAALAAAVVAGLVFWLVQLNRALSAERELTARQQRELDRRKLRELAEPHYHLAALRRQTLRENRFRHNVTGKSDADLSLEVEAAATLALNIDPTLVEAWHLRALARFHRAHRGDETFRGAESDFTRALELRPTFTPALHDRGRLYLHHFFDKVMWDNMARQNPLQSVRDHAEWQDKALADFRRLRELGGDAEQLLLADVAIPLAEQKFPEAIAGALEAIPKMSDPNEARLLLAVAYLYTMRIRDADKELRAVLKDWPRDRHANLLRVLLALFTNAGYPNALQSAETILETEPDNLLALGAKGEILKRTGKHDEATVLFEKVLASAPHTMIYASLGDILLARGDAAGAMEKYDRSLEIAPDWPVGLGKRAELRRSLGDWAGAEADFARLVQVAEPSDSRMIDLGRVREKLGKLREAAEDYAAAVRIDEKNSMAWLLLGAARTNLGEWSRAEADLSKHLELARPRDRGQGHYLRGEARCALGDWRGAVEDLEKARELGHEADRLEELLKAARARLGS